MPSLNSDSAVGKWEQEYLQTSFFHNIEVDNAKRDGDYDSRVVEFVGVEGELDKIILRLIQVCCILFLYVPIHTTLDIYVGCVESMSE